MYGLDRAYGLSARTPHDRQPSITHDPVCDAWIDRQVSLGFRLFGPHPPHSPPTVPFLLLRLESLIRTCGGGAIFTPITSLFASREPTSWNVTPCSIHSQTALEFSCLPMVANLNGEDALTIPFPMMQVHLPPFRDPPF